MLLENQLGLLINFTECNSLESTSPLKTETEAADTCKQIKDS